MKTDRNLFQILIVLLLLATAPCAAQDGSDSIPGTKTDTVIKPQLNTRRLAGVLAAQGTLYAATLGGLYYAWYSDYPQSSFHFFNDNNEWMQVDKLGHAASAFYISRIGYESYRWCGLNNTRSAWFGGLLGFAYMLNIEILDGFSAEWGFSPGDLLANTTGCFLFIGQQLGWKEQRFVMKYSFHQTEYPPYNPSLLGENLVQQMVKDYNGMTIWLSGNISAFLPKQSKFPRWLDISVGYGAEGMTGSSTNTEQGTQPDFPRYRQYYLSMDVDLTRIRTNSKVLKGFLTVFSFIKIPFPTLSYSTQEGIKFYYLYF